MDKNYHIEREETLAQGYFQLKRFDLKHTLYQGGWGAAISRELLVRKNAVGVVLYDPDLDVIVLIEQFRIGALREHRGAWLTEIVAGEIEDGETAVEVACRETLEEAGCEALELIPIQDMYLSPGGSTEKVELFCARIDATGLHDTIQGVPDEGEDILVKVVPYDEVIGMLETGAVRSAIPLAGLLWLALNRERVRAAWGVTETYPAEPL